MNPRVRDLRLYLKVPLALSCLALGVIIYNQTGSGDTVVTVRARPGRYQLFQCNKRLCQCHKVRYTCRILKKIVAGAVSLLVKKM